MKKISASSIVSVGVSSCDTFATYSVELPVNMKVAEESQNGSMPRSIAITGDTH